MYRQCTHLSCVQHKRMNNMNKAYLWNDGMATPFEAIIRVMKTGEGEYLIGTAHITGQSTFLE